jgi:copper homeostasis protein
MMPITLEVIAASVEDAIAAEAGGADRLELLSDLTGGGVTPSYGLIHAVRRATRLPIFVMIRARPGSFLYSPAEVAQMAEDARIARELGADGIVVGALTADGAIDTESVTRILAAGRLPATFHRAFERLPDPVAALPALAQLPGVERVLVSGVHWCGR